MSTVHPDFIGLKKASRNAGLISLAGVLIVLGAIAFSMWRLADTEAKLANEKEQVKDLERKKEDLSKSVSDLKRDEQSLKQQIIDVQKQKNTLDKQVEAIAATIPPPVKDPLLKKLAPIDQIKLAVADRNELEKQVEVVRQEAALIRDAFKNRFTDPKKNLKLWNDVPGYHRIMATVLVTPKSKYKKLNKPSSPTGKWYDFSLYLDFPTDAALAKVIKRDIETVTYQMNHPYLDVPPLVSHNANDDFMKHYEGAGTLRNVVVRIDFKDKDLPVTLDYDMTKAHPEAQKK
jgi:cell division protein FtsB